MADPIDTDIDGDDPFVRAGELALGVLEGEELSAALQLQMRDSDFADAVRWWETRLSAMQEAAAPATPSREVLAGILARIDALDGHGAAAATPANPTGASRWSIATALAGFAALAASIAIYVATPGDRGGEVGDPQIAQAPSERLIAQLQDESGERQLAGVIDPAGGQLALKLTGFEAEAGKAPELWVIPAGGAPVSLGQIPQSGNFTRELSERERSLLVEGSALAITFEDAGEIHTEPSPPILIAGALDRV